MKKLLLFLLFIPFISQSNEVLDSAKTIKRVRTIPEETFVAGEALYIKADADSSAIINGGYPINVAGYIDIPILGKYHVAGKSREQLEKDLGEKLASYLRDTHLRVRPAIRLNFLGHFQIPGMHYIMPDDVVWDAFRYAGGPATEYNWKKMKLMRGSEFVEIDLHSAFSQGLTLREAGIKTGDTFLIPTPTERGFWFYFKETIMVTGSLAGTISAVLSTYLFVEYQMNQ